MIPTTSDLFTYTYSDTYPEIRRLQVSTDYIILALPVLTARRGDEQKSCLQKADEKVAVAQQAYEMIDAQMQRLDTDICSMEKILQVGCCFALRATIVLTVRTNPTYMIQAMGEYETVVVTTTKPTDLAACQVSPGSEWILAKIIEFDDVNGTYKLADEDMESNKGTNGMYTCTDEKINILAFSSASFRSVFDLPEQQVVVLSSISERLQKDDKIYAVYPDTTSFYPATVSQAPKKGNPTVVVNFADDADELGITHDKTVHIQHVMPPPH